VNFFVSKESPYKLDLKSAEESGPCVGQFLSEVVESSAEGQVHVVAHSLGLPALWNGLKMMTKENVAKLGQIIFIA
jgi:esterase/lipase superfamily enzyme